MRSNSIKTAVLALAIGLSQWANTAIAKEINGKDYKEYTVKKGETLFGICRKFNTTIAEMEKVNPKLKNGLKSDATIYVPNTDGSRATLASANSTSNANSTSTTAQQLIEHKVVSGETLSGLARKYKTTISDISARNESVLRNGLKSGSTLKIYQNSAAKSTAIASNREPGKTTSSASSQKATSKMPDQYTVKKGETLYGICRKFGCSVKAVEDLNPQLKKRGLYEGEKLLMPNGKNKPKGSQQSGVTVHEVKKGETVYSIANNYQVKTGDIERLNPSVKKDGLKAGKPIIMPSTSKYLADKNSSNDYRVHKVQKDETVFSISQKFGISQNDVQTNNNLVQNKIIEGQLLALPPSAKNREKTGVASIHRQNTPAADPKHANIAHSVRKGETMFSICQAYKVSESELIEANPELKTEGLKADRIIFIPRSGVWSSNRFMSTQGNNRVNVAILLPFSADEKGNIDGNTDKFLEFYQGALLAVKQLKERNVWVNMHVFNSGKTAADMDRILAKEEMRSVDFIIGPAYKAQFAPLSSFSIAHNVKMVVPFSSRTEEMKNNPNIFLVNAPKNKVAEETALHITSEFNDKNVVMLKFKNEKLNDKQEIADSIATYLRRNGTNVRELEYTKADALKDVLLEKEENIVLTTSTDQVALTQLIPSINSMLPQKYDVKIFGYSDWTKYQTISNDLFLAETYFASVYDIDFNEPVMKEFISDFREYFGQEPGNTQPMYGALGYDIMLYFGNAVALYGKNFDGGALATAPGQVQTLQSDLQFKQYCPGGGFYNSDITISKNNGQEGHVILNKNTSSANDND